MENDYNKFLFSVKKAAIAGIFVLVFQKFSGQTFYGTLLNDSEAAARGVL